MHPHNGLSQGQQKQYNNLLHNGTALWQQQFGIISVICVGTIAGSGDCEDDEILRLLPPPISFCQRETT